MVFAKRSIAMLLTMALMLIIFTPAPAPVKAEGEKLEITVYRADTLDETLYLDKPGNLLVDVKIKNTSPDELEVSFNGQPKIIPPGEVDRFDDVTLNVKQSNLEGDKITLTVDWALTNPSQSENPEESPDPTASPQSGTQTKQVTVIKAAEATVNVSPGTSAAPETEVTFTYEIESKVPGKDLESVKVTDAAVFEGELTDEDHDGIVEVKKVVNESITSHPTFTYKLEDDTKTYTTTASAKQVSVQAPSVTVSAVASKSEVNYGETVKFTITVKNESALKLTEVEVKDERGYTVTSGREIEAGITANYSNTVTIRNNRNAYFIVKYKYGETSYEKTTNTIAITALNVPEPTMPEPSPSRMPGKIGISVTATPSAPEEFPAVVTFSIAINNEGTTPLLQVVVTEETLGEVGRIEILGSGSKTIEREVTLEEAGTFEFKVTAVDEYGNSVEATSSTVAITNPGTTAAPTISPSDEPSPVDMLGTLLTIMLVIIVLIILSAIVLVILMIIERRRRKRRLRGKGKKKTSELDFFEERPEKSKNFSLEFTEEDFEMTRKMPVDSIRKNSSRSFNHTIDEEKQDSHWSDEIYNEGKNPPDDLGYLPPRNLNRK